MARTNVLAPPPKTHEGAKASRINAEQELRRTVMATMLWEDSFYESGVSVAERIDALCKQVSPDKIADMAIEAREKMKLRHVPLKLCVELARRKALKAETLTRVIQRADELTEFLSIYSLGREGSKTLNKLSNQVKKGLAAALGKFNEYQLAKYNRPGKVKLRDVLFLTHAKPKDETQKALWKKLAEDKLATPDTWEVELSASKDKKASWNRLLSEKKLGALALLRNLRNMEQSGVSESDVRKALSEMDGERVLPFRYIAAAKAAKRYEDAIDEAMVRGLSQYPKLPGKTVVIVDVSGSMYGGKVSAKSDMDRAQAACALAAICREVCETPAIYATAGSDRTRKHQTEMVPSRRGMALVDAVYAMCGPLGGGGIFLKQATDYVAQREKGVDRTIVVTDEQDCDISGSPQSAKPLGRGYIINVSNNKNGIGYGTWTHVSGWSEAIVDYIRVAESVDTAAQPD